MVHFFDLLDVVLKCKKLKKAFDFKLNVIVQELPGKTIMRLNMSIDLIQQIDLFAQDVKRFLVLLVDAEPLDIVKGSGVAVRPDDRFVYVTGWCSKDIWAIERLDPGVQPGPLGKRPRRGRRLWRNPATAHRLDCAQTHRVRRRRP